MAEKWLYWLEELGREQNDLVGKKCAHLGEIAKIGLPVPHGFALSVHAYTHFMKETGATPEIAEMIEASRITAEDIAGIERLSLAIRGVGSRRPFLRRWNRSRGLPRTYASSRRPGTASCGITTS
jgi:pyruvate,water dikinase